MITEAVEKVRLFQKAAKQYSKDYPTLIPQHLVNIRAKWIYEELQEFTSATNIYEQADAITDLLYYILGAYVDAGIDPDPLFEIIHKHNMEKIDPQNLIKADDGKILKPATWIHPDGEIKACIDCQINMKLK